MTTAGHSLPVCDLLESILETVGSVMSAAHVTVRCCKYIIARLPIDQLGVQLYLLKPGVGQAQRHNTQLHVDECLAACRVCLS